MDSRNCDIGNSGSRFHSAYRNMVYAVGAYHDGDIVFQSTDLYTNHNFLDFIGIIYHFFTYNIQTHAPRKTHSD